VDERRRAVDFPPATKTPIKPKIDWQRWLPALAALLVIIAIAWLARRWPGRVRAVSNHRRAVRHESEEAYFSRLLAACRSNDAAPSYAALAALNPLDG